MLLVWVVIWEWKKQLDNSLQLEYVCLSTWEKENLYFFYKESEWKIDWENIKKMFEEELINIKWFDISIAVDKNKIWINYDLVNELKNKNDLYSYYALSIDATMQVKDISLLNNYMYKTNVLCVRWVEQSRFFGSRDIIRLDCIEKI